MQSFHAYYFLTRCGQYGVMLEKPYPQLRQANLTDATMIAHLMNLVSDGATELSLSRRAANDETWLDVARRDIADADNQICYKNAIMADLGGDVAGMMILNWLASDTPPFDLATLSDEERPANELVAQVTGSLLIRELVVFERFRRLGIASAFLELAASYAKSNKIPALSLTVHGENANAITLYRRNGFVKKDERSILAHETWAFGSKLWLMVKKLN